jgi:hypothetical protein
MRRRRTHDSQVSMAQDVGEDLKVSKKRIGREELLVSVVLDLGKRGLTSMTVEFGGIHI